MAANKQMRSLSTPFICFLSAALALTVYLLTLSPDLTWANFSSDGGELITAALTWGVPHPPGYPAYVVVAHFFSWLPVGTAVYRLNLLSAVCVAGAVGLVTAVNYRFVVGDLSPSDGDKSPTTNSVNPLQYRHDYQPHQRQSENGAPFTNRASLSGAGAAFCGGR
ncbi:MAG TPA: DUF2723 domain-containing protein, partial [Chloroflexota bacterium]|nr:DUF2723 domain-containing protein [Chloroflexota bacterium]